MNLYLISIATLCLALFTTAENKESNLLLEDFDLPMSETTGKYLKLRQAHFEISQQKFFSECGVPFPPGASLKLNAEKNTLRVVNERHAILLCMWVLSEIEKESMHKELTAKEILEREIKSSTEGCSLPVIQDVKKH